MNVVGLISVHFFSEGLKMAENGGGGFAKNERIKAELLLQIPFRIFAFNVPV